MLSYKLWQSSVNPLNANPNTHQQPAALLDFFTKMCFVHSEYITLNQSFMQKIPGWAENIYSLFCTLIAQQPCKKSSSYTQVQRNCKTKCNVTLFFTKKVVTNIIRKAKSDHLHYQARTMFLNHIFVTVISQFFCFSSTGCLHAIPCKWSVHHGGFGIKFSFLHGWIGLHYLG